MSLTEFAESSEHANPVDVVERMATTHDWSFARASEDEVTLVVTGKWSDYQISFTWMSDIEALHLACAFELKVPAARRNEMIELVTRVNEQLWVGHFDLWFNDGLVMYRHALLLTGGIGASRPQCESALGTALEACERYYQAFQFVLWAGKSAGEAIDAILFETSGQA